MADISSGNNDYYNCFGRILSLPIRRTVGHYESFGPSGLKAILPNVNNPPPSSSAPGANASFKFAKCGFGYQSFGPSGLANALHEVRNDISERVETASPVSSAIRTMTSIRDLRNDLSSSAENAFDLVRDVLTRSDDEDHLDLLSRVEEALREGAEDGQGAETLFAEKPEMREETTEFFAGQIEEMRARRCCLNEELDTIASELDEASERLNGTLRVYEDNKEGTAAFAGSSHDGGHQEDVGALAGRSQDDSDAPLPVNLPGPQHEAPATDEQLQAEIEAGIRRYEMEQMWGQVAMVEQMHQNLRISSSNLKTLLESMRQQFPGEFVDKSTHPVVADVSDRLAEAEGNAHALLRHARSNHPSWVVMIETTRALHTDISKLLRGLHRWHRAKKGGEVKHAVPSIEPLVQLVGRLSELRWFEALIHDEIQRGNSNAGTLYTWGPATIQELEYYNKILNA